MEKRKLSSGRESKSEQVCLQLLLKDGDVVYFPEVFKKWIPEPVCYAGKKPVPVAGLTVFMTDKNDTEK